MDGMQTSESDPRKQSSKAGKAGLGPTVVSVKAAQSLRKHSCSSGVKQLPEVDKARQCSTPIRNESESRTAERSTAPSRIVALQKRCSSEGNGNQHEGGGADVEDHNGLGDNGKTQYECALGSHSYIKSDISMFSSVPHHELPHHGGEKAGQVQLNFESVEKSVFTPKQLAFGDGTSVSRNPHDCDTQTTAALDPLTKIQTTVTSTVYSGSGVEARKSSIEAQRSMQPPSHQLRCFSSNKDAPCRGSRDGCSAPPTASCTLPIARLETEFPDSNRAGASGSGNFSEAKVPSAPTGCLPETSFIVADVAITDTHENTSRDRRSAQFLRGMLGVVDGDQAGFSGGGENDGGNVNSAAAVPNPLRHPNISRASGSGFISNAHYAYGAEISGTRRSPRQKELHVHSVNNIAEGDRDQCNTDSLVDGRSLGSYRGELEWLCVPSLFYLFANIIKWNELRLQRRASRAPLEEDRSRLIDESFSFASIWTPNHEQELHALEDRISFSVFELEGVYLNPFLVSWSKPKLRSLVADVASTWEKEGPYTAEFDCVSSRLFDAISTEQTCQLRSTFLFAVRQWLGSAQHRWGVTCVLIALLIVSILCIVFLGVYGHIQAVRIVLSTTLSVGLVFMFVVAVLVLHHNTYADAASRYFHEEVVRAAQQKMEEEEMAEKVDRGSRSGYGHRGVMSRDAADAGCRGYTAGDGDPCADDEYMDDEISLAVRNLRALTECSTHPATNISPYYRLSDRPHSGRCGSGGVGGGFEDDLTLADGDFPSLNSRSLQAGDKAKQLCEKEGENRLLLSHETSERHQAYMDQCESHGVHEHTSTQQALHPTKQATPSSTSGATGAPARQVSADSCRGSKQEQVAQGVCGDRKVRIPEQRPLQELPDLPGSVNVTALLFCRSASVLSQVASFLWEHNFMLLRANSLATLNNTFTHGSEGAKVVLIHAPDVPEGSAELETVLSWLQVEKRPVFFFSCSAMTYPAGVPFSTRLLVPFSTTALNTLLLGGIDVGSERGRVSSPVCPLQEQELQKHQQHPSQPFQVPPYTLGRRLGGGAFGNVFEAEMEHTGAKCAVKRMYLKEDSNQDEEQQGNSGVAGVCAGGSSGILAAGAKATLSPGAAEAEDEMGEVTTAVGSQLREIAQEVEIMSSLQHPNIVRYYYCERDDNCISIFMELCTGGSLRSLIHSGKLVSPPEIKQLLREIISAVSYLHNMRIVHRDLKPDNVLFRHGHIKITDFGTAVHKHGGDLRLIRGTFAYMAPEILVGDPYGRACDVWSIGCIAAEVLSVELPQHVLGLPEMCEYYRAMGENSELPIECDVPGVRDFLFACLQRNPNQRSTAAELFYHPILQARDTSIHDWMVEVVARRRRMQKQQQALHRNGLSSRTGGMPGGPGDNHQTSSNTPNNNGSVNCANAGDGFDLHSNVGSAQSLDSSKLMRQSPPPAHSELTA
ncbi:protein kinase, putative [Leishmania tarentolae]|uniref:Protein kinase, putative n=1 Tax=Leishmania tarentolae TaxID=5689 RepID=A0A640K8L5_LEITA|nr:protein kinase, putative [Leishmania tarentolae]